MENILLLKNTDGKNPGDGKALAHRTLVQAAVVALVGLTVLLFLKTREVFLLIFAGLLLAIFLHSVSRWISQKTGLSQRWALAATGIGLTLLILGIVWVSAPQFADQTNQLARRLPQAVEQLQRQLLQYEWARTLFDEEGQLQKFIPKGSKAVRTATGIFSSTFGALGNCVIVLAVGVFIAINPGIYISGMVKLVSVQKRSRAREVLQASGAALESWLLAKIVAMTVIGVLTTSGLWLIGVDLALVLGLIAGILSFIPNIGPLLALLPAVLMALVGGPEKVIYVVALYASIQAIESYVLTPLLQQRMVALPPALVISMQVLLGVLAGGLGLIVATPLTAVAMVMSRMLYIEDFLGDKKESSEPGRPAR